MRVSDSKKRTSLKNKTRKDQYKQKIPLNFIKITKKHTFCVLPPVKLPIQFYLGV